MTKEIIDKRYMSPKRRYKLTAQRKRKGDKIGRKAKEYNAKHANELEPFPDLMLAESHFTGFGTRFKIRNIVDESVRVVVKSNDDWERWEK